MGTICSLKKCNEYNDTIKYKIRNRNRNMEKRYFLLTSDRFIEINPRVELIDIAF